MVNDNVDYEAELRKCNVSPNLSRAIVKGMALYAKDRFRNVGALYAAIYPKKSGIEVVHDNFNIEGIPSNNLDDKSNKSITIPSLTNIRNKLNTSARKTSIKRKWMFSLIGIGLLCIVIGGAIGGKYMQKVSGDGRQGNSVSMTSQPEMSTASDKTTTSHPETSTTLDKTATSQPIAGATSDKKAMSQSTAKSKVIETLKPTTKPSATEKPKPTTPKPRKTEKPKSTTPKPRKTEKSKSTAAKSKATKKPTSQPEKKKSTSKKNAITDIDSLLP